METTKKYLLVLTGIAGLFAGTGQEAHAAFELNFLPSPDRIAGSENEITFSQCNFRGTVNNYCFHGGGGNAPVAPDFTPFLREYVSVAGVTYTHMIVGSLTPDPLTGEVFAQETYIRSNSAGPPGTVYSSSGGKPGCFSNTPNPCGGSSLAGGNTMPWQSGNGQIADVDKIGDPLSGNQRLTGNATGNPQQVIIRQVMKSSEFLNGRPGDPIVTPDVVQEFLKANLLLKPKITQATRFTASNGSLMNDDFTLDMSAIDYNTNANGVMINKFTTNDPDMPLLSRNFDAVANAQFSDITGGQYTFTPGLGWLDNSIHGTYTNTTGVTIPEDAIWSYDEGTYTYARGDNVNLKDLNWKSFKNPAENPVVPVIP